VHRDKVRVGRPRSERSHRAILDTAARLLRERGYANITIEGVAAEAGVGKTTIYRRWSNKASLYMDLYAELAARIVPPADTGDLVTDLVLLVRGAFKLYWETAAGLALAGIVAEAQSNAAVSRIVRNEFVPSRTRITLTILERAAKRGDIRKDIDLRRASELVSAAVWFYVLVGRAMLDDKDATRLVKTLVHGICPDESARARRVSRGDGKAKVSRKLPASTRSSSAGSHSGSRR
jgi:AcrR family transcriptional regulator